MGRALVRSAYKKNNFYFSTKTYVVGTQKNRLNETYMFKMMGKKILIIIGSKILFI